MDRLQITGRFESIPSGNLAEFKQLAARALEITKGEPGALQYDWFFNEDESECVVREAYKDSDTLLAHIAALGDLFGQLLEVGGGCTVEVFGRPSPELIEATTGMEVTVFPSHLQGI